MHMSLFRISRIALLVQLNKTTIFLIVIDTNLSLSALSFEIETALAI